MYYKRFEIENFKGIKSMVLDVSLNPEYKATTLVGLNESGKTTLLEAINLIQKDINEKDCYKMVPRNAQYSFSKIIKIKAILSLTQDDEDVIKKISENRGFIITKDIKQIELTKEYPFQKGKFISPSKILYSLPLFGKKKRSKITVSERDLDPNDPIYIEITKYIDKNLKPPIIYYPNFLSDFPEEIYLKEEQNESQKQKEYRRVIQDILDSLNTKEDKFTLKEDILDRYESKAEEDGSALDSLLLKMAEKITEDVFGAWKKILGSKDAKELNDKKIVIKIKNKEVINSEGQIIDKKPYLSIKVHKGPESYEISEQSLGFRWFFSYFLFTEFRKNRAIDKGEILFLIDEPASNLHSTAQHKLLETFEELVKKSRLIYTTHSHHLINPNWLEGAYIVQNKALDYKKELGYDSSRTDIEAVPYKAFVAKHPDQQTYFQPILDKLDYKPSKLEMVPDMVIVEGKNDFYTLKYFDDIFLNKKYKDLHLCPGNGAGQNDKIIQLYIAWGRNFIVITDGDSAGEAAKEKYYKNFGEILKNKIFTLNDVSPSFKGLSMEGLFSTDAEKIRITQEIFPTLHQYSKQKFNQSIQNLLFLKKKANLNKKTQENISTVFTFLEEKLFPKE